MRRATPCRTTSWSAAPRRATASFTSTTSQASEWRSTGTTPSVTRPDAGRSLTAERWVSQVRGARMLRGDRATHRRAMHQTALGHVVVLDRPVLDHAVVPHQHVARPPLMAIHERGLDDVIRQGGDQRLRLVGPYPLDAGAVVAHHVEALAARPRMGPHDGMANRWVTVDFRLRRRQGPLASAKSNTARRPSRLRFIASGKASQAAAALANSVSPSGSPCNSGISMAYRMVPRGGLAV